MKKFSTAILATMVAMTASVASSATYTTEVRVDFDEVTADNKHQTACSTGTNPSCFSSTSGSATKYLEAFDTSLGVLNSFTVTTGIGIGGSYILRGDGVVAPKGTFTGSAKLGNIFFDNSVELSSTFTNSTLTNSTSKTFRAVENSYYYLDSLKSTSSQDVPPRYGSTIERSAFQNLAYGYNSDILEVSFDWDLAVKIQSDYLCDGTPLFGIGTEKNPCGATNRITGLNGGQYSTASVVTPLSDFWWVRGVYDYTPTVVTPPVSEVPLPASSLLLLGGLGGLVALRRRKKN